MSAQPLTVQAVAALQAGEPDRARRLLAVAEQRDGRALAPHLFLADLYLRSGRIADGLREAVNLARLAPNGISSAAPFIAAFARDPAHWPQIRGVFEHTPQLSAPVLSALAADPANVPALLALARGNNLSADAPWVAAALSAQVDAGRYSEARALWRRLSGASDAPGALIHDPDFRDSQSPPPFNWMLTQSGLGLAERRGGLHVTFYGSQSGSLVRQMLLLGPGRYRLIVASQGKLVDPQALAWTLTCAKAGASLAELAIHPGSASRVDFAVPADCPAQWLSLDGREQDIGGDSDLTMRSIQLERLGG